MNNITKSFILATLFFITIGNAQQAAEGHYQNTGTTSDEVIQLQIRNGSSLSNILGNFNFGSNSSQNGSGGFYYAGKYFSSSNSTASTPISVPNKNIGNGVGAVITSTERTLQNFIADDGSGETLDAKPIIMKTIRYDSSINGTSGDGQWDISETILTLTKQTNNNTLLPANCWYIQTSPECADNISGATTNLSKTIAFKFTDLGNGNFQWVKQTTWPDGTPLDVVQNLSNTDFGAFVKTKMNVYPNPIKDKFKINFEYSNENFFIYKIYDLTGREVLNGENTSENEINIQNLKTGSYILICKDNNNNISTKKIIKE